MLAGLGALATGCSSYPSSKVDDHHQVAAMLNPFTRSAPVVVTNPEYPVVANSTMEQLTAGTAKIVGETEATISSLQQGLPEVQKIYRGTVYAVTEQDGWFFYATSIAFDKNTYQPVAFISGYAIRRGDRAILEWSILHNR
ncbi:MAG TPA: hypothetical protein VNL17_02375 [Verrucomicrobiae bacterium]|nr:hypothetical protein [Verrucomicrobiae bacterium]